MTKIGPIIKDKTNEEKGFEYASLANIILKAREAMIERTNSKPGDCLFFIAEVPGVVETLAGQIRDELGKRLNLIDENKFENYYVTELP